MNQRERERQAKKQRLEVRERAEVDAFAYEDTGEGVMMHDSAIGEAVATACRRLGIGDDLESLTALSNTTFKAVLWRAGRELFPLRPVSVAKMTGRDLDRLEVMAEAYVLLCRQFGKMPSCDGFEALCNLPMNSVNQWGRMEETAPRLFQIWDVIRSMRLAGLKDRAVDSNNVTGLIAVSNWEYSLSSPYASMVDNRRQVLHLDSLPDLGALMSAPHGHDTLEG